MISLGGGRRKEAYGPGIWERGEDRSCSQGSAESEAFRWALSSFPALSSLSSPFPLFPGCYLASKVSAENDNFISEAKNAACLWKVGWRHFLDEGVLEPGMRVILY